MYSFLHIFHFFFKTSDAYMGMETEKQGYTVCLNEKKF